MKKNISRNLLVFILIIGLASLGSAQRQTGALSGKVVDDNNDPLPGAVIVISGPALMGTQDFVSNDSGNFRFPALPPGDYEITCELDGFTTLKRTGIIIGVGKTTTLSLTMALTTIKENILVTAESPVVDVKSSKVAITYTKELLDNVPMERDLAYVINSAPGAVPDGDSLSLASVHGSPISHNQYSLDGLNTSDPFIGFPITLPDLSSVDEMEMETGAHPAEVGSVSGAYVNIVTSAGGNDFSGDGTVYYFNESFVDENFSKEQLDSLGIDSPGFAKVSKDFALNLGGPVVKDRLWFFASGRYTGKATAQMSFPLDRVEDVYQGLGKLTLQLSKNVKIMSYYNYRTKKYERYNGGPWRTPEATRQMKGSMKNINGQLSWVLGPSAFLDVRSMYVSIKDYNLQYPEATHNVIDIGTGITSGAWPYSEYGLRDRWSSQAALTVFADNVLGGNHEIKIGAEFEKAKSVQAIWAKEPLLIYSFMGSPHAFGPGMGYFSAFGYPATEELAEDAKAVSEAVGLHFYIQDSWTIADRLTLNLGVRYDRGQGSFPAQRTAEVPEWLWLDPDFYSSKEYSEVKDVLTFTKITPRLGLVFDVFGNGKTIAKASFSQYMDPALISSFYYVNPNGYNEIYYVWLDLDMNEQMDPTDYYIESWKSGREDCDPKERIDPNPRSPYWNEIIIGIDHEVLPDFRLGLSYIYKSHNDIWDDVEKNMEQNFVQFTVTDPGYDGAFGTADDRPLTLYDRVQWPEYYVHTNVDDAFRKYRGLELVFEKRMSHGWQFLGSIVYSKTWGTMGNYFFASCMPAWGFDTPNWMVNREGRLDTDRPLVIKLQGSYQLPYGINCSAYFIHSSGTPFGREVGVWSPGEYNYVTVRAEAPTRRNPSWNSLSLRLEKTFNFGDFGRLGLFADVYNALNNGIINTNSIFHGYIEADGSFRESPTWQTVSDITNPRYVKIGVRFSF